MRAASLALVVTIGCAARSEGAAPSEPLPVAVAPATPVPVAARAATKTAPATEPARPASADCSERLTDEDARWIGRELTTGTMPGPSRLTTYVLAQSADRASLVVHEESANKPRPASSADLPSGEWRCDRSTTVRGTFTRQAKEIVLRFADAADPTSAHEVRCMPRTVALARATALRVSTTSRMEGCKASRWASARDTERPVLSCVSHDPAFPVVSHPVFLSQAPGVEHVTIDEDDCGDPVEALRSMPDDGSIAVARRTR